MCIVTGAIYRKSYRRGEIIIAMNIPLLIFNSILLIAFVYLSKNVWLDAEAFLEYNRRRRSRYSVLWSIFPYNIVVRFNDRYPKFELWSSRIGILFMYLVLGSGLVLILTNSLR